jgi:uncharacterized membrane protein YgaE (UPF0421/DUF939 family)
MVISGMLEAAYFTAELWLFLLGVLIGSLGTAMLIKKSYALVKATDRVDAINRLGEEVDQKNREIMLLKEEIRELKEEIDVLKRHNNVLIKTNKEEMLQLKKELDEAVKKFRSGGV